MLELEARLWCAGRGRHVHGACGRNQMLVADGVCENAEQQLPLIKPHGISQPGRPLYQLPTSPSPLPEEGQTGAYCNTLFYTVVQHIQTACCMYIGRCIWCWPVF